jgi:hypothetical protein
VILGIVALAFIGWYYWDSAQNRGLKFGYFGVFNRVQNALVGVPGVTITRSWANHDVTLEEFGFYVTTPDGESLHLDFQEADPIRQLSGRDLTAAIILRFQSARHEASND